MKQTIMRFTAACYHLPVHWTTVILLAILVACADGFWLVVVQGVVGAIERIDSPFQRWLLDSTLLLPLVFLAVLGALLLTRRWCRPDRPVLVGLAVTVLLVAVVGSSVGLATIAANSMYDYSFQWQHMKLLHALQQICGIFGNAGSVTAESAFAQMTYAMRLAHVRALGYTSLPMLMTNLVLAASVLTLWEDRLWKIDTAQQPDASYPQTT